MPNLQSRQETFFTTSKTYHLLERNYQGLSFYYDEKQNRDKEKVKTIALALQKNLSDFIIELDED